MEGRGETVGHTTIKVRLHPTAGQAVLFEQTFGCCRYLWNQMLADEQRFYRETGEHFIPTPARYKREAPFLKEVDSMALANVHQNLKQAFDHFFRRPETCRYPVFKRRKEGRESYTTCCQYYPSGRGSSIYLTREGIRLPKAGVVRAALYRRPLHWWTLKTATVSRSPTGKYFCSLLFEFPQKALPPVVPTPDSTLGLSQSPGCLYVDSQGNRCELPQWLDRSREKLARLQAGLARMERGSRNYEEQQDKIRRLHEHMANQRKDFLHKESRRIANAWDAVCVRECDLQAMARLTGREADGFGLLRTFLTYKLAGQGKALVTVDPYFPSARTCHHCGYVYRALPDSAARWQCPACGAVHRRGVNGAVNLRDRGLAQLYESRGLHSPR